MMELAYTMSFFSLFSCSHQKKSSFTSNLVVNDHLVSQPTLKQPLWDRHEKLQRNSDKEQMYRQSELQRTPIHIPTDLQVNSYKIKYFNKVSVRYSDNKSDSDDQISLGEREREETINKLKIKRHYFWIMKNKYAFS